MMNELARDLIALTLASSAGVIAILLVRRPARLLFGPIASHFAWWLVPVAMGAELLPHGRSGPSPWAIVVRIDPAFALSHLLASSAHSSPSAGTFVTQPPVVLGVWLVGAAFFGLYLAGVQRAFVKGLGRLSGVRSVLRAETSAGCPVLLGVFRPRLILPADFNSRYTRRERMLILAHERMHLRRGDGVWNALAAVFQCMFWFNPLAHLASRYFRIDQEMACDAEVLRNHTGARRSYASAMLKTQLADAALPIGCHWQSTHFLKERLQMVKQVSPGPKRRTFGYVFVSLVAAALGYSVWAAQPSPVSTSATSAAAHVRVLSWPQDLTKFYPAAAKARGVEGMAYVAVTVDRRGRATDTRILSVTPRDMGFGAAASTMVHFMTFSNATGHDVVTKVPVKFALPRRAHAHHHVRARNRAA
jgi:bla regulator protein BlaR1